MRRTAEDKKHDWISSLIEARRAIIELARAFPKEFESQPLIGVWMLKDFLAHLIGWDKTNIAAITEIINGEYPAFFRSYDRDWKTYNELLVSTYQKPTLDELLKDTEASHGELIAFLEALPASALVNGRARNERGRTITIANLLRAEAADELEHARQVRAFLSMV